jgi:hypothetical protein
MTSSGGQRTGGQGGALDDLIEGVQEMATDTWFIWLPGGLAYVAWWGWTNEAWIGADGWDRVRFWLAVAGAVLVALSAARVAWVLRSWRARVAKQRANERAGDALVATRVKGEARIMDGETGEGFIQLDRDAHMTKLQRERAQSALSAKLGRSVELGEVDAKDRVPIRPAAPPAVEVDKLAEVIPAIPYPKTVDIEVLKHLHVGTQADGKPFLLDITGGRHPLIVGATGSGKGSVEQSILRQCAPLIHAGLLRVIFVDPKGGIEGVPVRWMCERVIICRGNNVDEVVEHFQSMVNEMEASAARVMSMGRRDHVPTREHPATLLIIDEVASLTKYLGTPKTQREIEGSIGAMTTQGRAAGWHIAGVVQDPRKEVLSIRNLFPQRIALRLAEEHEVDWVLGSAVRQRGAECHLISKHRQGTAYVAQDGDPEPLKVRFAFPNDDDLLDMCRRFRAPGEPVVWGLPDGVELPPLPGVDIDKGAA